MIETKLSFTLQWALPPESMEEKVKREQMQIILNKLSHELIPIVNEMLVRKMAENKIHEKWNKDA